MGMQGIMSRLNHCERKGNTEDWVEEEAKFLCKLDRAACRGGGRGGEVGRGEVSGASGGPTSLGFV